MCVYACVWPIPTSVRATGLPARKAAAALGYTDLQLQRAGSFWLREGGGHEAVQYGPHEELPAAFEWVDYGRLEAFYAGEDRGWGLRCTRAINDGTFVVEVLDHSMRSRCTRRAPTIAHNARPNSHCTFIAYQ